MTNEILINNRVNQITGSTDWLTFTDAGFPDLPETYTIVDLDADRATDGGHYRNLYGIRLGKIPDPDTLRIFEYLADSNSDSFDSDSEAGAEYTRAASWPPAAGEFATSGNGDIVYFHASQVGVQVAVLPYEFRCTPLTIAQVRAFAEAAVSGSNLDTLVDTAVDDAITALGIEPVTVSDTATLDLTKTTGDISGQVLGVSNVGAEAGTIKFKTIAIGDWNMNSTASVNVAHGLTAANIRSVSGVLRNDSNATFYPITPGDNGSISQRAYIENYDGTNIVVGRNGGALFGSDAEFNGTGFSRGWLIVGYIA